MTNSYIEQLATRREIETEKLKKRAGKCSRLILSLGIMSILLNLAAVVFLKIFLFFGSNVNGVLKLMDRDYINVFFGMLPCMIIDLVVIYTGTKATKINLKNILKMNIKEKKITGLATMSIGGVLFISTLLNGIYMLITEGVNLKTPSPDFSFPKLAIPAIMYVVYVCLIGPILEELIFRGIILHYMKPYGKITAMIFSSILFTMFHLNLIQFMTPLLLGLVLSFVVIKTESIKSSIIMHIFNNTMATLLSLLSSVNIKSYGVNISIYGIVVSIYMIFGIASLALFVMRYKDDVRSMIEEEIHFSSLIKKVSYCFCNLWSEAYIAFYIVIILVNFVAYNIK